jgi:microsomal prostaglandin-E synthase 2
MSKLKLYQFELCPYCHKVKAGLDLKGIPYEKIDVNPMNKKEMAHIAPAENGKKKVPVVEFGDTIMRESGEILRWLDEIEPTGLKLNAEDEGVRTRAEAINDWVDNDLIQVLPTVLYGTWGEAIKAARLTANTSSFSRFDNLKVSFFGSVVMKMIAKRTLKKRGAGKKTGAQLLATELNKLEKWLGDQPYLCGETLTLADAATHGALSCVKAFPAFGYIEERPTIKAWYERVAELRSREETAKAA